MSRSDTVRVSHPNFPEFYFLIKELPDKYIVSICKYDGELLVETGISKASIPGSPELDWMARKS